MADNKYNQANNVVDYRFSKSPWILSFLFDHKNIISAWLELESNARNDGIHVFLTSFKNSISSCKTIWNPFTNFLSSSQRTDIVSCTDSNTFWKIGKRVVRFECTILKMYTLQWCVVVFTWLSSFVSNSTNYEFLSLAFSILILFLEIAKEMGIY